MPIQKLPSVLSRLVLAAAWLVLPVAAAAQGTEAVPFWIVAGGGGGDSTGGGGAGPALSLAGSVGQPVLGTSASGGLELTAGFWRGWQGAVSAAGDGGGVPAASRLLAPYPNPFNPSTTVGFALTGPGAVHVRIFDARGRMVRELVRGEYPAGRHEVVWDGRDDAGGAAPSGVYFVRFETDDASGTRKMTLLK